MEQTHDMRHNFATVDPVELAISEGHAVAIDVLTEILSCATPSRALAIAELLKPLIETLSTIQLAALSQATDLLNKE